MPPVDFSELDFSNMTDEQLKQVLDTVKAAEQGGETETKEPKEPEPVSVTLSDGTKIEAGSQEELNRLLAAKLEEHRSEPQKQEPPKEPTKAKPEWNMEEFTKKFLNDPREGIDYLETARYGFPVSQMVPLLVAGLAAQAKKLQELETQRFLDTTPEYEASPENRQAIERVMRERGWQPSYQTLRDAFDIARARGLVKTKEEKKEQENPKFVPPRVSSAGKEGQPASDELLAKAYGMPLEQLEEMLLQAGVIKSRRAS